MSDSESQKTADSHEGEVDSPKSISMVEFLNTILRHRRLIAALPILIATIVVITGLVSHRTFTSSVSFSPQTGGEDQLSRLSGIASQFGIGPPSGQVAQSPQFYADFLRSRHVLATTVESEYEVATERSDGEVRSRTLIEIYDIQGDSYALQLERAVEQFEGQISVSVDSETGVVRLAVTTRWPELSRSVAERMIELVNRFNLETRRSQASEESQFLTQRLSEAQRELRTAEDSLEAFLHNNRRYQDSPGLRFEHDRFQRQVSLHQQLVSSLAQSLEQAKMEAVRNTPVITVVEPAETPARPDPRRLKLQAFLGLVLGVIVGLVWAFGRDIAGTSRQLHTSDYREFLQLRDEAIQDLRRMPNRLRQLAGRLWRRLRQRVGRS